MTEYLFLVPDRVEPDDGSWNYENTNWTQASIDGQPVKTTVTGHFDGKMPLVLATEHLDYYSLEEHIERLLNESDS